MKQHKIKPIFRNKAKWRCLIHSDITYINKYKPKMLSTVELKSMNSQEINGIRNLCKALTDTKRISSLIITDNDYDSENFTILGHLLKITNRWKNLTLKFIENQDEEEGFLKKEKLRGIARLRRCQDLSNLNLSLNCPVQIENKLLRCLSQQLQGLPNLESLHIDVSSCYSNDYNDEDEDDNIDINAPILKFKYPRSLSFLRLNFQGAGSLNLQLLPKFISNIQRCDFLHHIDLDFHALYYHMETSEAEIWTSLAEKTPNLKTLTLNKTLHSHEIEANKAYLDNFQHLQSLTNLNVTFYFYLSEQNNQFLSKIFFTHLASFINLKSMNLTFSCTKDHPDFLHLFILQSFSQLEQLRLYFGFCCNIDNQFLQDLGKTLPSLCRLQNFELTLPSSNISHEGIIALSSSFKLLPQLKNLFLNLKNLSIDHKTIEVLSNSIAHLSLTSLKIILNDQPEKPKSFLQKLSAFWESQKRLTSLFSALYGLNSLQNLYLNLSAFDICTKEFKHFSLALKELKHLSSLSLELPQFDSGNNFEGLRRLLSGLKELQKLDCLHLVFKGVKLCDREIELIASNLRDCGRGIEDLELRFEHGERLGNGVLDSLGLGLQNLLSLKNLTLIIGGQNFFPHEAVFDLSKRLAALKSLENLILDIKFKENSMEVREIRLYMKNHQNLKNLTNFIVNNRVWI